MTLSDLAVLVTLTTDTGKILAKLHQVSPVSEKKVIKLAKKLKKEKVNIDIVSFGEDEDNTDILNKFITTINGKEGTGSHLVTIPPGPHLSDALVSSPIVQGEDGSGALPTGSGYEFGVDPNEDPELALALRVSMEEQRARQEAENTASGGAQATNPADPARATTEKIESAMRMSMAQEAAEASAAEGAEKMDVDEQNGDEDYSEAMNDPAFLQSVLESLPGVDPQSDAVRQAVGAMSRSGTDNTKKEDSEKKDDKSKK